MPATAEEAREEVEGVMAATATSLACLVLLEAFVAVLVVDAPGFGRREGVVCFGYLDKFLGGGIVATIDTSEAD